MDHDTQASVSRPAAADPKCHGGSSRFEYGMDRHQALLQAPRPSCSSLDSNASDISASSGHSSGIESDYGNSSIAAGDCHDDKDECGITVPPPREFCDDRRESAGSALNDECEHDSRIRDVIEHLGIALGPLSDSMDDKATKLTVSPSRSLARELLGRMYFAEDITPATIIPSLLHAPYNSSTEAGTRHRNPKHQDMHLLRTGQVDLVVNTDEICQELVKTGACVDEQTAVHIIERLFSVQGQLKIHMEVALEMRNTKVAMLEPPYCVVSRCEEPTVAQPPPPSVVDPPLPTLVGEESDGESDVTKADQRPKAMAVDRVARIILNGIRGALPSGGGGGGGGRQAGRAVAGGRSPTCCRAAPGALGTIPEWSPAEESVAVEPASPPPSRGAPQRKHSFRPPQAQPPAAVPGQAAGERDRMWSTCDAPAGGGRGAGNAACGSGVRRPKMSEWRVVPPGDWPRRQQTVLSDATLATAQNQRRPATGRGQVVFNVPAQHDDKKLSLHYAASTEVLLTACPVSITDDGATINVSICNRQASDSAFFCLRFFAHKWPMHVQLLFPLVSGVEEIKAGHRWERKVEVYGMAANDWCSFEVFSVLLSSPRPVWSLQRAPVKLSMLNDCVPMPDKNATISAVTCAVFSAVHSDFGVASRSDVESMIFAALRLDAFQRPSLQALLYAALGVLQAKRGDPRGSLVLCANVYRLRQLVPSSSNEPCVWALVEMLVSAIEKEDGASTPAPQLPPQLPQQLPPQLPPRKVLVPDSSASQDAPEPEPAGIDDSARQKQTQMDDFYRPEEKLVNVTLVGGEVHFGEELELTVDLSMSMTSSRSCEVAVRVYNSRQLLQRLTALGIGSIGRPVFLAEMRCVEPGRGFDVESVLAQGKLDEQVCTARDRARLGLKPRLLVWRELAAKWVDVTNTGHHLVSIRSDGSFSISCPYYPRVAVILVSTFIETLSYGLLRTLTMPTTFGVPVVLRAYLTGDEFCRSLHMLTLTCEDAEASPDAHRQLIGHSNVVHLVCGTTLRLAASGTMKPCSEYGETSLSTQPYCFHGKHGDHRQAPYMTADVWVVSVDGSGERANALRGRVAARVGEVDRAGPSLADFAIAWPSCV